MSERAAGHPAGDLVALFGAEDGAEDAAPRRVRVALSAEELSAARPWRPPALDAPRPRGDGPGRVGGLVLDPIARADAAASTTGKDGTDDGPAGERARAAFDDGFAAGEKAGEAAAREALGGAVAELARAFERETRLVADALEEALAELAREMAGHALRRRLDGDAALLIELAREGLEALAEATSAAGPATVRLHPDDAALLEAAGGAGELGPDVRIVADPALGRADCRLERGPSRIDASVRARLRALAEADDAGPRDGGPRDDGDA